MLFTSAANGFNSAENETSCMVFIPRVYNIYNNVDSRTQTLIKIDIILEKKGKQYIWFYTGTYPRGTTNEERHQPQRGLRAAISSSSCRIHKHVYYEFFISNIMTDPA